MKRKSQYISGRGVRYYDYQTGAVEAKKPWALKFFATTIITFGLLGGAGYGGLEYLESNRQVLQSNDSLSSVSQTVNSESDDSNLQPFQAVLDKDLTEQIQEKVDDMPKNIEWSVSVRDLNSPRMANINADTKMESASLYKMFLLAPLEKRLSAEYWKSYAGSMPINDCVTKMIKVSDNDCPQGLGNYIGWRNIDSHNHELGFTNTNIGTKTGNQTTARDVNELMYRLQNSMILSDKARRLVFDALYEQEFRSGIPAGCGNGCLVANKTGDIDGYRHDTAVVTNGDSRYVVTIMTKGASWSQIAEVAASIDEAMQP